MRISVRKAVESFGGKAVESMTKELVGIHKAKCWRPVMSESLLPHQRKRVIRSFMFLKENFDSGGLFEELKARTCKTGGSTLAWTLRLPLRACLRSTLLQA